MKGFLLSILLLGTAAGCATAGRRPGVPLGEGLASAGPSSEAGAGDDAEIERRVDEDSRELKEQREAEARGQTISPQAPGSAAEPVPGLPELQLDLQALRSEFDIPIDVNAEVLKHLRILQSPEMRPYFVQLLSRFRRYAPRLQEILREQGLPEDTVFLAMVESGFANRAVSRARAVGSWQLVAATARRFGLRRDFWVDERRDPEKATLAAARFLSSLHQRLGDWRLAWAAYNAGPVRVLRARRLGYDEFWDMARARRVLPAETRAYVARVMAAAILTRHAAAFGLSSPEVEESEPWSEYQQVEVPRSAALTSLARAAQVTLDRLLDLNPELRRTRTPPRPYWLKLPRENAPVFARNWPALAKRLASAALGHRGRLDASARGMVRVRPGDTFWSLARRLGVEVRDLARWNGIEHPERTSLRAGRVLAVRPRELATSAPEGSPVDGG